MALKNYLRRPTVPTRATRSNADTLRIAELERENVDLRRLLAQKELENARLREKLETAALTSWMRRQPHTGTTCQR